MHTSHPLYGEIVTSNRLIRGGRWVFRGTLVPLDEVSADLASGLSQTEVWEKHGALDRRDLAAVAAHPSGEHAEALRAPPRGVDGRLDDPGLSKRSIRRAAA